MCSKSPRTPARWRSRTLLRTAFGVKVAKVNTLNVSGKAKRLGAGRLGKTRSWKKAYVQLD